MSKQPYIGTLTGSVLKALGFFGSVQFVTMLTAVIRTKLVAIWIGPAGVGLFGLFNAALETISSVTQLNIRTSAVKDIASGGTSMRRIAEIVVSVRRWSWILGCLGALLCIVFSGLLSEVTFGDSSESWNFKLLSFALLLSSLTGGESAILQGKKKLKQLARASLIGNLLGLAFSIPLYYYLRIDSIVLSLVAYSAGFFIAFLFVRRREHISVGWKQSVLKGRDFVRMGIFMTISSCAVYLGNYIFLIYLNNEGGVSEAGYYQAGFTLINRYIGILFSVMAMEYYPRLAGVAGSDMRVGLFVNHETSVILKLMFPCVVAFILFRDILVDIFYADEFGVIIPFITWAVTGSFFRAISWSMAFVMVVRGDTRIFLVTELASVAVNLTLNVLFYRFYGIDGLGPAYLLWYLLYTIIAGAVYRFRYGLYVKKRLVVLLLGFTVVSVILAMFY